MQYCYETYVINFLQKNIYMYRVNCLRLNDEILSRFLITWENVSREVSERVEIIRKSHVFFISIICMSKTLNYLSKVSRSVSRNNY